MKRRPEPDVEYALDLYFFCKEFGTLPRPGGLLDQDYYEMLLLKHVSTAYAERQEIELKQSQSSVKRSHV